MTSLTSSVLPLLDFPRTITLRDGTTLRLRALQPNDRAAIQALFARCSPETIRYRFLRMVTELSSSMLDTLLAVDNRQHVALAVTHPADEGERIVAVGRYIALADRPDVAEVSFLVEDALQRRGIGAILLDALAEIARGRGITRFAADVLADNLAMLTVFRRTGYALSSNISYGVTHVEFPILYNDLSANREQGTQMDTEKHS